MKIIKPKLLVFSLATLIITPAFADSTAVQRRDDPIGRMGQFTKAQCEAKGGEMMPDGYCIRNAKCKGGNQHCFCEETVYSDYDTTPLINKTLRSKVNEYSSEDFNKDLKKIMAAAKKTHGGPAGARYPFVYKNKNDPYYTISKTPLPLEPRFSEDLSGKPSTCGKRTPDKSQDNLNPCGNGNYENCDL